MHNPLFQPKQYPYTFPYSSGPQEMAFEEAKAQAEDVNKEVRFWRYHAKELKPGYAGALIDQVQGMADKIVQLLFKMAKDGKSPLDIAQEAKSSIKSLKTSAAEFITSRDCYKLQSEELTEKMRNFGAKLQAQELDMEPFDPLAF